MIAGHGMGDIALLSAVSDIAHMEGLKGVRMGIDHAAEYDHPLKYVYNMNYHRTSIVCRLGRRWT